jgi:hypothetical protein
VSVGLTLTKADIDNKVGSLVVTVRDALLACSRFCDLLNDSTIFPNDAAIVALGYTQAEVTLLRAAFTDLKTLNNVAHAAATVSSVNDFFFSAKHLSGVVV